MFPSPYGDYGSYLLDTFRIMAKNSGMFPSPYGDYGSYHLTPEKVEEALLNRFRPLTGIMVLIGLTLFAIVSFIC